MDVVSDERAIQSIFFACSSMCIMCECNKENVYVPTTNKENIQSDISNAFVYLFSQCVYMTQTLCTAMSSDQFFTTAAG